MKIHTIFGTTGEYSDREEWPIVSYVDEEKAQLHVMRATEKANEWKAKMGDAGRYDGAPADFSEYDPNMKMDYTGTSYYYETTELIE